MANHTSNTAAHALRSALGDPKPARHSWMARPQLVGSWGLATDGHRMHALELTDDEQAACRASGDWGTACPAGPELWLSAALPVGTWEPARALAWEYIPAKWQAIATLTRTGATWAAGIPALEGKRGRPGRAAIPIVPAGTPVAGFEFDWLAQPIGVSIPYLLDAAAFVGGTVLDVCASGPDDPIVLRGMHAGRVAIVMPVRL